MSQKYIKSQNNNSHNAKTYGKYYAKPSYDEKFIETDEIADFIQTQATLKRSDIKAALDELGAAMKHFLEMGQKIRLAGIGIFKVGFSSIGVTKSDDCTASTITSRRVLFQPETERIVVGSTIKEDGKIIQKYVNAKTLVKDVAFEEAHGKPIASTTNAPTNTNGEGGGSNTNPTNGDGGSNTGGNSGSSETVAAPTISGNTSFAESTQVSMSGPDGAEIRYTTDGSVPTAESTLYSAPFSLTATTTVKAIAIKNGVSSEVTSKTFTKSSGAGDDAE